MLIILKNFFLNVSIEKPKIKHLKNVDLLDELTFLWSTKHMKTDQAFSGSAR